jgi:uncharacterized membrane protein YkvA (DUF1232 family)
MEAIPVAPKQTIPVAPKKARPAMTTKPKVATKATMPVAPAKPAASRTPRAQPAKPAKVAAKMATRSPAKKASTRPRTTTTSTKPAAAKRPLATPRSLPAAMKMKARSAHQSLFFAKAQQRARRILKDPDALIGLAQKAERKAARLSSGMLSQLKTCVRLIRAYAKGDYKQVSWESMVVLVGAVLYVASPIDLIPDAIPVAGILDDATVLSFALRMVHEEVQEFLAWEKATGRTPPKASSKKS